MGNGESTTYVDNLIHCLENFPHDSFSALMKVIISKSLNDKTIFVCGNGGSASTASHFVVDINKGARSKNNSFRAISLNDNVPTLTAIANDLSYDLVFSEQLKYLAKKDDLLIVISASGNSSNILEALRTANNLGIDSISITGYDGGVAKNISLHNLNVETNLMQIIEDIHLVIVHMILMNLNSRIDL